MEPVKKRLAGFYKQHLYWRWVRGQNDWRIARLARHVARQAPPPSGKPVVFFNASTRISGLSLNAAFGMLAAWSLRLSGVPVVHFVCYSGMTRCVLGIQQDNPAALPPCSACLAQSQSIYTAGAVRRLELQVDSDLEAELQRLDLDRLLAFTYRDIQLGKLVTPALRWVLRRHHLPDDAPTRTLAAHMIRSAWAVSRQFGALLDEVKPRAVVVFNGMFFPEATARAAALQRGLKVITHEVGLQPYSAYFTTGEATAYPINIPSEFELLPEQDARLDAYLAQRFLGDFSMAGIRFWPEMTHLSPEFLEIAAGFKQVVPVFTNVIFDTSQPHSNVAFPHMFAWLDQVLDLILCHPETLFVIRAHPDESRPGKESRESVANWIRKNNVNGLPNVVFVDSGEYFSSYELIQRAKFVMIYNSTIGLEASLMGAAVLCGGKARFTQYPTVFFPPSPEEYRKKAEEFLTAGQIDVPVDFRRNARRFLYYQLFRTSLPFGDFVTEDKVWKGFVALKFNDVKALLPENSPALKVIQAGILQDGPFLLEEP